MKIIQFKYLEHFSPTENWGDLDEVQWHHVHHLYLIRKEMKRVGDNWPMVIHCCHETSGHSPNSYHYRGLATDFHFVTSFNLIDQFLRLENAIGELGLMDFLGVGAYPEWRPAPGGFHIDSRGTRLRWTRIGGEYKYGTSNEVIGYMPRI